MSTTTESKIRIQLENFSVSDEIETMKKVSRNIGGITTFLGTGRELSKGQNIAQLNFEHYPKMAEKKLEEIRQQAIKDHGIIDMSIIHRIGPIEIGENIVLIVAVGEHRKETFVGEDYPLRALFEEITKEGEEAGRHARGRGAPRAPAEDARGRQDVPLLPRRLRRQEEGAARARRERRLL